MKVLKTIKLYINGEFPRTESGRSYPIMDHDGKEYARVCQGSRKDFRNAVEAAKNAQAAWSKRTAYNRGQILYRMGEMAQGKLEEFSQLFQTCLGLSHEKSVDMAQAGIDAFIYYAGLADKYTQILCSVNQVNGPFHNFTTPTPIGITTYADADKFDFKLLVSHLCAIILSGNSVVAILGKGCPAIIAPLSEVFATSDLPPGVINLITGSFDEVAGFVAGHHEVQALFVAGDRSANSKQVSELKLLAVDNMKRLHLIGEKTSALELVMKAVEMQTIWHPIGV